MKNRTFYILLVAGCVWANSAQAQWTFTGSINGSVSSVDCKLEKNRLEQLLKDYTGKNYPSKSRCDEMRQNLLNQVPSGCGFNIVCTPCTGVGGENPDENKPSTKPEGPHVFYGPNGTGANNANIDGTTQGSSIYSPNSVQELEDAKEQIQYKYNALHGENNVSDRIVTRDPRFSHAFSEVLNKRTGRVLQDGGFQVSANVKGYQGQGNGQMGLFGSGQQPTQTQAGLYKANTPPKTGRTVQDIADNGMEPENASVELPGANLKINGTDLNSIGIFKNVYKQIANQQTKREAEVAVKLDLTDVDETTQQPILRAGVTIGSSSGNTSPSNPPASKKPSTNGAYTTSNGQPKNYFNGFRTPEKCNGGDCAGDIQGKNGNEGKKTNFLREFNQPTRNIN